VNDLGTAILVVLLFCDPHGLEGTKGSQNAATKPNGVEALWWR